MSTTWRVLAFPPPFLQCSHVGGAGCPRGGDQPRWKIRIERRGAAIMPHVGDHGNIGGRGRRPAFAHRSRTTRRGSCTALGRIALQEPVSEAVMIPLPVRGLSSLAGYAMPLFDFAQGRRCAGERKSKGKD